MLRGIKEFGLAWSCRQYGIAGVKLPSGGELEPCLERDARKS